MDKDTVNNLDKNVSLASKKTEVPDENFKISNEYISNENIPGINTNYTTIDTTCTPNDNCNKSLNVVDSVDLDTLNTLSNFVNIKNISKNEDNPVDTIEYKCKDVEMKRKRKNSAKNIDELNNEEFATKQKLIKAETEPMQENERIDTPEDVSDEFGSHFQFKKEDEIVCDTFKNDDNSENTHKIEDEILVKSEPKAVSKKIESPTINDDVESTQESISKPDFEIVNIDGYIIESYSSLYSLKHCKQNEIDEEIQSEKHAFTLNSFPKVSLISNSTSNAEVTSLDFSTPKVVLPDSVAMVTPVLSAGRKEHVKMGKIKNVQRCVPKPDKNLNIVTSFPTESNFNPSMQNYLNSLSQSFVDSKIKSKMHNIDINKPSSRIAPLNIANHIETQNPPSTHLNNIFAHSNSKLDVSRTHINNLNHQLAYLNSLNKTDNNSFVPNYGTKLFQDYGNYFMQKSFLSSNPRFPNNNLLQYMKSNELPVGLGNQFSSNVNLPLTDLSRFNPPHQNINNPLFNPSNLEQMYNNPRLNELDAYKNNYFNRNIFLSQNASNVKKFESIKDQNFQSTLPKNLFPGQPNYFPTIRPTSIPPNIDSTKKPNAYNPFMPKNLQPNVNSGSSGSNELSNITNIGSLEMLNMLGTLRGRPTPINDKSKEMLIFNYIQSLKNPSQMAYPNNLVPSHPSTGFTPYLKHLENVNVNRTFNNSHWNIMHAKLAWHIYATKSKYILKYYNNMQNNA
ncbi:hypothetical protein A3Q56_02860 [Intoshia linei]|uniref:Uncharacterized protein n=1 Tax=Intoshia linei TaxID=1819745 RepID=A0A177B7D7_9BILA|nr:hypothetical protein A3Q56_02860 [Intoshia linei]